MVRIKIDIINLPLEGSKLIDLGLLKFLEMMSLHLTLSV